MISNFHDGAFYNADCFDIMRRLPAGCVDMILCDLPYGTTQNKWDSVLPLDKLWAEYWRVAKPDAAIVLTAAQPFTAQLVMSQLGAFRYEWIWYKTRKTGNLNAKKRPMLAHETVLVFFRSQPTYVPYTDEDNPLAGVRATPTLTPNYGGIEGQNDYVRPDKLTKHSVLSGFDVGNERGLHPTQKPVTLFEYLIKTYTNEGQIVLDNTAGSGTTAIAARNTGRKWICIEKDPDYFAKAVARVRATEKVSADA